MRPLICGLLLALYATAFTTLSHTAMASPVPRQAAHPSPPGFSIKKTVSSRSLFGSMRIARNLAALSPPPNSLIITQAQSNQTTSYTQPTNHYSQFVNYYKAARESSRNIKKCAAQPSSLRDDSRFQKKCVAHLNSFNTNVLGQQTALAALAAEKRKPGKGLDNYDRSNDIETLIKQTINLHKDTLACISDLVKNIPVLGPILGPIVYNVKCFLDDVLNYCEIFLDGTLNTLQPLLKVLLGSQPTATCPGGVFLAGLCI